MVKEIIDNILYFFVVALLIIMIVFSVNSSAKTTFVDKVVENTNNIIMQMDI